MLEYLRRHERRTGTKEGCAEGDCGACTVVLSEPDGEGGLKHRAVNSCIQFVSVLHGRQLTTVEDLKAPDGTLHPVQQALVDHHGSQCGFCTPGFVMQLYAGWLEGELTDRQAVKDWLAGNLCRCTGYGPIIDAGVEAGRAAAPDQRALRRRPRRGSKRSAKARCCISSMAMQQVFAPRSADELAEIYLAASRCRAGRRRDRRRALGDEAASAAEDADRRDARERPFGLSRRTRAGLTLGATVSHRDATTALARLHPDLGELMRRFASIQIRNAGTVGGNIANGSPIGDLPPALIALDARLTLRRGVERREIPLEDFFIAYGKQDRAPGEFVESRVRAARFRPEHRFACYKISKRFDQDISAVMGAFRVEARARQGAARRGLRSAAWRRRRSGRPKAEAALAGSAFDERGDRERRRGARRGFRADHRHARVRRLRLKAAQNLLRRFHLENAAGDKPATRVLELA